MISSKISMLCWIYIFKTWIFQKTKFCLIFKVKVFFSVWAVFPTFSLNLGTSRYFDLLYVSLLCNNKLFVFLLLFLYKNVCKNVISIVHIFVFSTSYSNVVIKIYSSFKIEIVVNHKHFVCFSFLELDDIRATYSKYFQNNISEAAVSSVTLKSTTLCFFLLILYTLRLYNKSLY